MSGVMSVRSRAPGVDRNSLASWFLIFSSSAPCPHPALCFSMLTSRGVTRLSRRAINSRKPSALFSTVPILSRATLSTASPRQSTSAKPTHVSSPVSSLYQFLLHLLPVLSVFLLQLAHMLLKLRRKLVRSRPSLVRSSTSNLKQRTSLQF